MRTATLLTHKCDHVCSSSFGNGIKSKSVEHHNGHPRECTYGKDAASLGEKDLVLSDYH